jgi:beta-phosphoglucomutase
MRGMAAAPRAVLWDLDGTLVDSEECHWLAWRETLAAEGVQITHEQFDATFGQRNASFLPGWLGEEAASERVERVGDAKEACFRRLVRTKGAPAMPGAIDWLRRLHQDGWQQAIASSAPRLNVEAILAALDIAGYFQAVVSGEDVQTGKPDPQVFLIAANRLGVAPSRCIVVEDAAAGVEGARRAGMYSVGLQRSADPLAADVAVGSLTDLERDVFMTLLDNR